MRLFDKKTRRQPNQPWLPLARLIYLTAGGLTLLSSGKLSQKLLLSLLLCGLPALLHLALLLPRPQPIASRYPCIFQWIYGLPALGAAAGLLTWSVAPFLGGNKGTVLAFDLLRAFRRSNQDAQTASALLCLGLACCLLFGCWKAIRDQGWKEGILGRPAATILTLLFVPACTAITIAQGCWLLHLPEEILAAMRPIFHAVLYSEMIAARGAVVLIFPVAICASLISSYRMSRC